MKFAENNENTFSEIVSENDENLEEKIKLRDKLTG